MSLGIPHRPEAKTAVTVVSLEIRVASAAVSLGLRAADAGKVFIPTSCSVEQHCLCQGARLPWPWRDESFQEVTLPSCVLLGLVQRGQSNSLPGPLQWRVLAYTLEAAYVEVRVPRSNWSAVVIALCRDQC